MTIEERKQAAAQIADGNAVLGIEFGSTRVKAVLIDEHFAVIGEGNFEWENTIVNGFWSYSLEDISRGLTASYQSLKQFVWNTYQVKIHSLKAIGISAMQHGYLAFNKNAHLLVPFRTWRNTNTGKAAEELTKLFHFNIPLRFSIAHLYQCILNGEDHVKDIAWLSTLAGYVHWLLSGVKAVGTNEASGMFPLEEGGGQYNERFTELFNDRVKSYGFFWRLEELLPSIVAPNQTAGALTREGALLLDPSGDLMSGIPMCPPEGDGGTGMIATNSISIHTGHVSAGTSVFGMLVLDHTLSSVYPEIDLVTTPDGKRVGMAHANNCTSDINAWVGLFDDVLTRCQAMIDRGQLFTILYKAAMEGESDGDGLIDYPLFSGEPIIGTDSGIPMFLRSPESRLTIGNFMRAMLYSSLCVFKIGMDIMLKDEKIKITRMMGHGGLFKTPKVGQQIMADALNVPITVMETAGEGGAWGMAILAAYSVSKSGLSLQNYLNDKVFSQYQGSTIAPDPAGVKGFDTYLDAFKRGINTESEAAARFL